MKCSVCDLRIADGCCKKCAACEQATCGESHCGLIVKDLFICQNCMNEAMDDAVASAQLANKSDA